MDKEYLDHAVFNSLAEAAVFYRRLSSNVMSFVPLWVKNYTIINYDSYFFEAIANSIISIKAVLEFGHITDAKALLRNLFDQIIINLYFIRRLKKKSDDLNNMMTNDIGLNKKLDLEEWYDADVSNWLIGNKTKNLKKALRYDDMKKFLLESDLARERQRAGDDFWLYVCTQPRAPYATEFIDHPGVELRTWLWQCWAENVRGILVWHSNLWTEKAAYPDPVRPQNPYADPQVWSYTAKPYGNGDGRFIYPPESVFADIGDRASPLNAGPNFDKPVGSIRGEMIRDGIEDYEYLAILHRLDPKNQLLKVPGDISKSLRDFSKSPAGIEKRRIRLAEEIERKVASAKGAN